MPSLAVSIDPENRTADDARRVSQNIQSVGTAAETTGRKAETSARQTKELGTGFGSLALGAVGGAAAVLQFSSSLEKLSSDKLSEVRTGVLGLAGSVGTLGIGIAASPIGATIGIIAGLGAAYASIASNSGKVSEEQTKLNRALADGQKAFVDIEAARIDFKVADVIGSEDLQTRALDNVQSGILGVIRSIVELDGTTATISREAAELLGIADNRPQRVQQIAPGGGQNVSIPELVEAYRNINPEETIVSTRYNELLDILNLELEIINKAPAAQNAALAAFNLGDDLPAGGEAELLDIFERRDQRLQLKQLSDDMSRAFVDPIQQGILAGQEFEEVIRNIGFQLQAALLQNLVVNPLAQGLSSAIFSGLSGGLPFFGQHGLATSGGNVIGHAHGGLLTSPSLSFNGTNFIMRREAGQDEFTMPATRVNQDLGVQAKADPISVAELAEQTILLRRIATRMESSGGDSFGMSGNQFRRRS